MHRTTFVATLSLSCLAAASAYASQPGFRLDGPILECNPEALTSVDYIQFDTSYSATHSEGQIHWNDDDKTMEIDTEVNGVALQTGQEVWLRATNKTGAQIDNGEVVYISSAQGQRPVASLADADTEATATGTIGMATHNIADNGTGYVTTFGLVRDIDTTGTPVGEVWAAGDALYLSSTAGAMTKTAPALPAYTIRVGYVVYAHATEGIVFVSVSCAGGGTNLILSGDLVLDSGDVADSGRVRLKNAECIAWEASPAGTDESLCVDASEQLTYSGPIVATGDVSSSGGSIVSSADVQAGAAGEVRWNGLTECVAPADGQVACRQADDSTGAALDFLTAGTLTVKDQAGTGAGNLTVAGTSTLTTIQSGAGDVADAGAIRLGNAEVIAWEASPAGTDGTLTYSSSNKLETNASFIIPTIFSDRYYSLNGIASTGGTFFNTSTDELIMASGSGVGRQWVFTDAANAANDHDHATQTTPTIFVHSDEDPDTDNTEWISIAHNGTTGVLDSGKGGVGVTHLVQPSLTTHVPSGTTQTIDWSTDGGNIVKLDLEDATGDVTLTISNGGVGRYTIIVQQDGAGAARDITWPASVEWANATTPVISAGNDEVDIVDCVCDGTSYYCSISQDHD